MSPVILSEGTKWPERTNITPSNSGVDLEPRAEGIGEVSHHNHQSWGGSRTSVGNMVVNKTQVSKVHDLLFYSPSYCLGREVVRAIVANYTTFIS